jgi:GTP diphosphokinase / guanosine-3',5'-bis(diphosphate) 3'-diphosphatase
MDIKQENFRQIMLALEFASIKHEDQRRKGIKKRPYINHPIKVASLLSETGQQTDHLLIAAALLHDTIEDTKTTKKDIFDSFGEEIANLVCEVTDNMKLPNQQRKKNQITHASELSEKAKMIKIADKTANILDLIEYPIPWSKKRKMDYITWTKKVVDECRGVNRLLENNYDKVYQLAASTIGKKK